MAFFGYIYIYIYNKYISYIYIYLCVCVCQPVCSRSARARAMASSSSRKRAYGDTLQDALQVSGSTSERALHLIMNAAQKDSNVSTSTFKRNVRKILAPAAAVFRAENLPAADGTHISCMMPDIAGIIRYMVRSSDPRWPAKSDLVPRRHSGRQRLEPYTVEEGHHGLFQFHGNAPRLPPLACSVVCLRLPRVPARAEPARRPGRLHGPSGGSDCVGLPAAF